MSGENPARVSRRAYAWLLAILIGTTVAFLTLPLEVAVLFAPFAPFALVGAIVSLAVGSIVGEQARQRAKMERGEGVIATWHLDAVQWESFRSLNTGTLIIPAVAAELFTLPALGVEVVFAEDAVYVDGDFHTMDRSWGTVGMFYPHYIELAQSGLESYTPLRIPIPPGYHSDAMRVVHHFNSKPAPAAQSGKY